LLLSLQVVVEPLVGGGLVFLALEIQKLDHSLGL
jgi:hypothetical protein